MPGRQYADLRLSRPHHERDDLWRLFEARRGPAGIRPSRTGRTGPRPGGPAALRGHHGNLNELSTTPLLLGRRRVAGSPIGGIAETQELLDFCARKNILPECEMIRMDEINEAFERMERSDVRYRFVIDMASLAA